MLNLFQKKALFIKNGVPCYIDKSEIAFRNDKYEQFFEVVQKNALIHLSDHFWSTYPYQMSLDWIAKTTEHDKPKVILDLGCGVGRISGYLAKRHEEALVFGLDYSYQMLKFATDYWITQKKIELNLTHLGIPIIEIKNNLALSNLNFLQGKAEETPFKDGSIDLIIDHFLFDRLASPRLWIKEVFRILSENGKLLLISPLNFQNNKHWKLYHPHGRLIQELLKGGLFLALEPNHFEVSEPIDGNGNAVRYKVSCSELVKK